MPRSAALKAVPTRRRRRDVVDELPAIAADEGIGLDEQLRIQAAIAAARAGGDVVKRPRSTTSPAAARTGAAKRGRRPRN